MTTTGYYLHYYDMLVPFHLHSTEKEGCMISTLGVNSISHGVACDTEKRLVCDCCECKCDATNPEEHNFHTIEVTSRVADMSYMSVEEDFDVLLHAHCKVATCVVVSKWGTGSHNKPAAVVSGVTSDCGELVLCHDGSGCRSDAVG